MAGVTDSASTRPLALVVMSWKHGNSANHEYDANRQQGRYASHHRHLGYFSLSRRCEYSSEPKGETLL